MLGMWFVTTFQVCMGEGMIFFIFYHLYLGIIINLMLAKLMGWITVGLGWITMDWFELHRI